MGLGDLVDEVHLLLVLLGIMAFVVVDVAVVVVVEVYQRREGGGVEVSPSVERVDQAAVQKKQ